MLSVLKRVTVDNYPECQHAMNKMSSDRCLVLGLLSYVEYDDTRQIVRPCSPFIETLRGATKLAEHILAFHIVRSLRDEERTKLKAEGYNCEAWFASISLLGGIFLRKFSVPEGAFEGVLDF